MFKKCIHKWIKQSDIVLPAPIEEIKGGLKEINGLFFKYTSLKKHILILTCTECGKIYEKITLSHFGQ